MHISTMKPYVYHPELQSKLILPLKHADLIETLAFERDFLMDDIIKGKSGGTTIICQGPAGTGKTLTAEIYAEVIKKPLYRVHSGQLGITADTVEESLKAALQRATRWKCILLIDECDVFLKQRGDSLEQNAIVAVFLRIIEYYDGLMFLTTNRQDDIDDAILSRCLAKIQYQKPTKAEREKLWATLSEVYKVNLTKKQCAELAERYDDCSGRDIKGLLRLAIKYARRKKHPMGLDDIYRLAPFRGM